MYHQGTFKKEKNIPKEILGVLAIHTPLFISSQAMAMREGVSTEKQKKPKNQIKRINKTPDYTRRIGFFRYFSLFQEFKISAENVP